MKPRKTAGMDVRIVLILALNRHNFARCRLDLFG
jgi:hypothetical protein